MKYSVDIAIDPGYKMEDLKSVVKDYNCSIVKPQDCDHYTIQSDYTENFFYLGINWKYRLSLLERKYFSERDEE